MLLVPWALGKLPEKDRGKWEIIAKLTGLLVTGIATVAFYW